MTNRGVALARSCYRFGPLGVLGAFLWLSYALTSGTPVAAQAPAQTDPPASSPAPVPAPSVEPDGLPPPASLPAPEITRADAVSTGGPPPAPPAPVQTVKTTQDAALLTPPPPPGTHVASTDPRKPPRSAAATGASEAEQERAKEAAEPMNWLGLTVRLGYASVAAGTLTNPTYNKQLATYAAMLPAQTLEATGLVGGGACTPIDPKCRTAARSGFQLALALNIGGSGIGFDVEPYITVGGNAFAAGLYLGPRLEIHLVKGLYLGLGLGARAAYVALDGWKNGADIFGRIPVHFTYYVARNFALVVEGSFGAGISLFLSEPVNIIDPRTNKPLAAAPKVAIGAARGWDLTFGLRFP